MAWATNGGQGGLLQRCIAPLQIAWLGYNLLRKLERSEGLTSPLWSNGAGMNAHGFCFLMSTTKGERREKGFTGLLWLDAHRHAHRAV